MIISVLFKINNCLAMEKNKYIYIKYDKASFTHKVQFIILKTDMGTTAGVRR